MKAALLLALALALPASAQVAERWVQRYSGLDEYSDGGTATAVDQAGNVLVSGTSHSPDTERDIHTVKYGAGDGRLLWEHRYAGQFDDSAVMVAVDSHGDVMVLGTASHRLYIAKYRGGDGAVIWENRSAGPQFSAMYARDMALDGDGNVIVTASNYSGNSTFYTAKYAASNGALVWERTAGAGPGTNNGPVAVAVDRKGDVVVTGGWWQANSFQDHVLTVKHSGADGAILWQNTCTGSDEDCEDFEYTSQAVALDSGGNAVITGYMCVDDDAFSDCYTTKYAAASGVLLWEKIYAGPRGGYDSASDVAVDAGDNVIITGASAIEVNGEWRGSDYYTAKYAAADGALLWDRTYGSAGAVNDGALAVVVTPEGIVTVAGQTWSPGSNVNISVVRYALTDGTQMSVTDYSEVWYSDDRLGGRGAMALTADGGYVFTGANTTLAAYSDWVTVYYAPPATAHPAWRRQFFGSPDNAGEAADAADPDHDGLLNLMEWACGLDPTTASPPPGIPGRVGATLTFQYPRSTAAFTAGVVFSVEWSDTLAAADWHTTGITETVLPGPVPQVLVTLPAGTGKRYARLRVTGP